MLFKIAFRNIFRQKRRTILTALTMFGGFTLAAISIGWSDGSYNFIINMFTRNQLGQIQIHAKGYRERPSLYKTIDSYDKIDQQLSEIKGVESWAPRVYSAGLVSVADKSAGARLIGIDPVMEDRATRFEKKIIKGKTFPENPSHETILGKGLIKTLEAKVGDEIAFVSQAADGSIANDLYTIIGVIDVGNDFSNRTSFYLHIKDAQDLLILENKIHEIAIVCHKLKRVPRVVKQVVLKIDNPNLEVAPWQVFARSFYQAMKADKEGMWIMLFVIILIVAVGVLNTVLMSVLERGREYGLLKAMGTRPVTIFTLVLYEVNILAVISIIVGAVLSLIFNSALSHHGITLPQAFTYGGVEFNKMYTEVNTRSFVIPTITVLISATLISIFPALRAAHTEPAKTMRM